MKQVNIHEAKTHLSRLVDAAARGEGFVIARAGKPLVRVLPFDPAEGRARARAAWLGALDGRYRVPDDLDRFGEGEVAEMFGLP